MRVILDKIELREALFGLGWSQVDLARRLGVHQNAVYLWASGKVEVPGYVEEYLRMARGVKEALGG